MSEEKKEYKIEGRPSTIFRVKKDQNNPYVMIDRRPIDNPKLSFKAKGILTYLLSRPDGWEVNVPDLVNHGTDGASSIRSGLKELRKAGHIYYNTEREGGYIRKWVIEVYEVPQSIAIEQIGLESGIDGEKALDDDFLQVENLQVENHREVLSTLSSNESKDVNERFALLKKLYTENIGAMVPLMIDILRNAAITYPDPTWYAPAFEIAVRGNGRNWNFVSKVLQNWKEKGRDWSPVVDTTKAQKTQYRGVSSNGRTDKQGGSKSATQPDEQPDPEAIARHRERWAVARQKSGV